MKALRSLFYFAYGSNMHPLRMAERVRTARPIGIGYVAGYALHFHKRGRDGSGKCNAMCMGDASDAIHGVVYEVNEEGKCLLDRAEDGYRAGEVQVLIAGAAWTCFTYIAEPDHIDESLRPFDWYKCYVLDGGIHHGLPAAHIQVIRDEKAVSDPDEARQARHFLYLHNLDPIALASPSLPDNHQNQARG